MMRAEKCELLISFVLCHPLGGLDASEHDQSILGIDALSLPPSMMPFLRNWGRLRNANPYDAVSKELGMIANPYDAFPTELGTTAQCQPL